MGDRYVSFPLRAVILPFGGSYEPLLVAFGQIAAWLSLLLIASFHVRRHIGGRVWRRLHDPSFVAFWLAVAHGLLLGTERTTVWANVVYLTTAAVVAFLTFYRFLATDRLHTVLVGRDVAQARGA
jgi:DMSO/TMAO reductase YedYZ heme-binding membrane subunit